MANFSGSVFGETLQTITSTKLEELAKQRISFEEKYARLLEFVKSEKDALKRVGILLDGLKECIGVRTMESSKDGEADHVTISGSRNTRLETDLRNLPRFIEQARFDPSVSREVLLDWEKKLLQYLSIQSTKFQYADLYGKLVTEWLSSEKSANDDGDVEMTESYEEVSSAKKLANREEWERDVFQAAEVDENALRLYLEDLFVNDKKEGASAIDELRKKVQEFEKNLTKSTPFDHLSLRQTIEGLQNSDLLSNEKREALRDFLGNNVILTELCDILNVRMAALENWNWGPQVLVEQRKKINGEFLIHFNPELLQAIFLHYIGIQWSVFFKSAFRDLHKHEAWKSSSTEVGRDERLQRMHFLGKKSTNASKSLENKRKCSHDNRYFAHQLLDFGAQKVEVKDGEEEAEYREYTANKRDNVIEWEFAPDRPMKSAAKPMFARRHLVPQAEVHESDEDDEDEIFSEDSFQDEEEAYRHQSKKPMESKQSLLHLVATEIIFNTRLQGEFTCLRTTFDSWTSLLPHQTISTVLEFLGVSRKWKTFLERYLQAPLKFADDPSSEPRLRRRGMPSSHTLSDVLGETVLLCLDFAVNQATGGPDLHRLGDDVWFWNKNYETCVSAWASILKFTEVMGVRLHEKKTGSVRISHDKKTEIDDRLPEGEIRWGFLQLDPKSGRFEIDQHMVDGHVEELRTQLKGKSKSVIDYIQAWNSYAATFFSSNFGKAANCFGREHVDKMLATHRHIEEQIFPDGSIVQQIKQMIEERFSVKNVPDGFLFFPVELGGLDLKSPFVHLLQIRESVKENPYDLLGEYEEKERDDYATAKRRFDNADPHTVRPNVDDSVSQRKDTDEFFSFEEFVKYREVFGSVGKASLVKTYKKLLERPKEQPVALGTSVAQAITQLSSQSNLRGILGNWNSMDAYWKWIAQMYGPEMIDTFGSLNVVDFGLLPIGMVSMFRQRRTKWQG
ncbi:hypothetical protein COCC4DRAFT_188788 [Bipolaris maydis ATCC 48331]|uniref:Reverse transcriptase domain-containing protein n=2 Tax=Cochliobolus heterostrophus TaxID=5016 RepID=M2UU06_COCH5|nr:uncharacterized protein COCC4DRAFT_188788 [Bipolaris maydis ATCC 48331]EMD91328.1 hypothetical protein COCHEDRAFT_1203635 [Bipolaris maydis C5]ENI08915.1 hypothetical protein COCC4DRAFT_188788 [Bipolaris maydis ATCC 48331]KAH7559198.1 hypothetical protein BM1_04135 [Bipolaris maydis]